MVPDGWREESLDKVSNIIDCKHRTPKYVEYGVPLISPGTIKWGALDLDIPTKHVSQEEHDSLMDHCEIEIGDLVMGRNQSVGIASYVDKIKPFVLGQDTILIKPGNAFAQFLFYCLQSTDVQRKIYKLAGGSTFSRINLGDIRKIKISLPSFPEQKKISKILSTWDKAIITTEQLIVNSQQQKKALMQQLLTGKKRLAGFSGEWKEVRLNDCAASLDNKRVPLNSDQRLKMQGDIPYWGANGILDYVNDYIFDQTIVLLAEDGGYFDEFASRPIAKISYGKAWVNNHAHILVAKENATNHWLYYSLVHKNILGFVNSGTRAKLNKKDMLLIPLLLPELEEQKKITQVLINADKEIETLQQKLEFIKQEKKALMQQLLTGKRRVQIN